MVSPYHSKYMNSSLYHDHRLRKHGFHSFVRRLRSRWQWWVPRAQWARRWLRCGGVGRLGAAGDGQGLMIKNGSWHGHKLIKLIIMIIEEEAIEFSTDRIFGRWRWLIWGIDPGLDIIVDQLIDDFIRNALHGFFMLFRIIFNGVGWLMMVDDQLVISMLYDIIYSGWSTNDWYRAMICIMN